MRLFKKLSLVVLILSLLFGIFAPTVFTPTAYAQAPVIPACDNTWYCQQIQPWVNKVYDTSNQNEIFGERYTAAQVEWIMYALEIWVIRNLGSTETGDLALCMLGRNDSGLPGQVHHCFEPIRRVFSDASLTNPTNSYASAEGTTNPVKIIFSRQDFSGIGYVREKFTKAQLVPEVKAQGFGFGAGAPIRDVWLAVRDISYLFLILAMVAMAFMIMFRVKLSPQTVITVQSVIPKIIVTLILVTFSYAIAGFMIDLLYVGFGLLAAVFISSGLFQSDWGRLFQDLAGLTQSLHIFNLLLSYLVWSIIIVIMFATSFQALSFVLGLILLIIIMILVIILLFKITWMLLKTFLIILLLIAVGPLYILGGLVGGGGFVSWLRNLAAHLAVFLAVGPMFAFSFVLMASALPEVVLDVVDGLLGKGIANAMPFSPQYNVFRHTTWVPPFTAGLDTNFLWFVGSVVMLTLIPKLADIMKGIVSGRPYPIGTAIGEAIGGAGMMAYGQGVRPELGYRAAQFGYGLQQRYAGRGGVVGFAGRGLGRAFLGWGEPQAGVVRDRTTGRIIPQAVSGVPPVYRKGEA